MKKREESLHNLWDIIKCTNIRIIEVPDGEEGRKGQKGYLKKKKKNDREFPKPGERLRYTSSQSE